MIQEAEVGLAHGEEVAEGVAATEVGGGEDEVCEV